MLVNNSLEFVRPGLGGGGGGGGGWGWGGGGGAVVLILLSSLFVDLNVNR